jgi:hypothetical protein
MSDIKSDFKKWLIENKKYKASTSKQFVGSANKVCQSFFNGNTDEHWNTLAQNIVPILVYYNECNNHEYYISADETSTLEKHFKDNVLLYLRPDTSYNKDIFLKVQLSFIYNAKEYIISEIPLNLVTTHIRAFQFIINQIRQSTLKVDALPNLYALAKTQNVFTGDLSVFFNKITDIISDNSEANKSCAYLHLQYTEKPSKQITKALWLFYEYINEKVPPLKPSLGYDELKNLIICINNAHDGLMKIITTVAWAGDKAKEIQANNGKGTLYPYEVQEALDLSPTLFRNMVKQGILKPTKEKGRYYKYSDINNLLKNALHQVTYPGVDYDKQKCKSLKDKPKRWCTREEAAEILKCKVTTVDSYKKNNLLTYIEFVPNTKYLKLHVFFYIPELRKVAKIRARNPRRSLYSLRKILKRDKNN